MPFRSQAQMRFLFARHPEIARRWARLYGIPKNLPEHRRAAIARRLKRGKRS
ncbi:MAG TPA: hypothetical protein VF187_11225 [Gemmatimonadales bacterium]